MSPDSDSLPPPKILHNREVDDATVHVTFALPGLRRATVSVPRGRWIEGGHVGVGRALAELLGEIDRQHARARDRLPGQGQSTATEGLQERGFSREG